MRSAIARVAPAGDEDIIAARLAVVRRVETAPFVFNEYFNPRVHRAFAFDVAGNIARGNFLRAAKRDHQMRVILAHAFLQLQ